MLRSGRLVILLCSSMNNISLASLPRQIVWIVFYNKWYLFMHFIICDKWWIKCSSFSLTGTWHNYTEPIYINFLLTYWMIISHVFFVWLWWRSNKDETCYEPYLQVRIEKSEMSRQKMILFEVENIKYFRCYCPFREKNTSPKAQRTQELGTLAVLSSLTHSTIFV